MTMTETDAKKAEQTLRAAGWDVAAQQSPIAHRGWELVGKAADAGRSLFGFSHADMKVLILGGQIARLTQGGNQ